MKKNPRPITVIISTIQKRTYYIKKFSGRQDGRFNIELTIDVKQAYDFSRSKANDIIRNIFNPHDREYVVEDTLMEA